MTSDLQRELESWPQRINRAIDRCDDSLSNYIIISSTASTQDTARQLNAAAGTVIIAGAQAAGRGRFGRHWVGEPAQGVYVSIVLQWIDTPRLAIASAIAVVDALRRATDDKAILGVKWPNDVFAQQPNSKSWRKISGVLVEQFGDRAIVGIGINVLQDQWPADLADRAVSLHELGHNLDRITVIEQLLPALHAALSLNNAALAKRFAELDLMTGRTCTFTSAGTEYCGKIVSIDPQRGLSVQLADEVEPRWFSAEATTLSPTFDP